MYQFVYGGTLFGVDGRLIRVEADISNGLPSFEMGGRLSAEVKESRERVRTALRNSGVHLPARRISLSLAPADLPKSGTGFDLAIAVALLAALELFPEEKKQDCVFLGELGLSGEVRPVRGVLPVVCTARDEGLTTCFVPVENVREARAIPGMRIVGVSSLDHALRVLKGEAEGEEPPAQEEAAAERPGDFADVAGMQTGKRAAEIAAAGMHNLLMIGPPGAGKSMLAGRIPGIMPPMTWEERIELTKIYSSRGLLRGQGLIAERQFRSPHHTITKTALAGGGVVPRAGEVTLAHRSILFLDELPEFDPHVLEVLRQPLEERRLTVSRSSGVYTFPADIMLVAAMNPCKCGFYPDRGRCSCSERDVRKYLGRISRPLLDRFDLFVEVPPVLYEQLRSTEREESSEKIRIRVAEARERQIARLKDSHMVCNAQMGSEEVKAFCRLGSREESYLEQIYRTLGFSARGYTRVLKLARTIADLSGKDEIGTMELSEAVSFRRAGETFWGRGG
ncbi:MAG: YifB family Mg chelatase-like AAA ATPase [Lachnospiraceae bacterium]|nr:YifB family Mg chelatase-like AAA ATPase [Lachnospiraceae bacterium]